MPAAAFDAEARYRYAAALFFAYAASFIAVSLYLHDADAIAMPRCQRAARAICRLLPTRVI